MKTTSSFAALLSILAVCGSGQSFAGLIESYRVSTGTFDLSAPETVVVDSGFDTQRASRLFSLDAFDTTKGVLRDVKVTFNYSFNLDASASAFATQPSDEGELDVSVFGGVFARFDIGLGNGSGPFFEDSFFSSGGLGCIEEPLFAASVECSGSLERQENSVTRMLGPLELEQFTTGFDIGFIASAGQRVQIDDCSSSVSDGQTSGSEFGCEIRSTLDLTGEQSIEYFYEPSEAVAVPEPATLGLLGLGILGIVSSRRRLTKTNQIAR